VIYPCQVFGFGIVAALCFLIFTPRAIRAESSLIDSAIGRWKLLSLYEEDGAGQDVMTFGRKPDGSLVLGPSGRFSLRIDRRPDAIASVHDPSVIAIGIAPARARMLAYSGRYYLEGHTIHFYIEHGLAPFAPASDVTIIGDRMDFISCTELSPTGSEYSHLIWERQR
jgi:Lipocalin-like domain